MTKNPSDADRELEAKDSAIGWGALFVLFGIYLLVGAYAAFTTGKWPIFMPPQLDLVALLLSIFGAPTGAYLAGGVVALLGAGCIWGGISMITQVGHA